MHIAKVSINTLNQLRDLLSKLDDSVYTQVIPETSHASIGQHVRHILGFYTCLIGQAPSKKVSYDKREREISLETSCQAAIITIDDINVSVKKMNENDEFVLEGELAGEIHHIKTNMKREMLYALEHAVHHMAIIKITVKILKIEANLSAGFGIAESTIKHKKCAQ